MDARNSPTTYSNKNDKRKTVKAVRPLRFREILVPICRNLTSTCRVQSPHTLTEIFLTGYQTIPDMIYVNKKHFPYAKKSLQTENSFGRTFIFDMAKQPTKHCFFYLAGFPLPMTLFRNVPFTYIFFSMFITFCVHSR